MYLFMDHLELDATAMDNWMRTNPGKIVTIYEVPSLVKEAQMVAMIPRNIM